MTEQLVNLSCRDFSGQLASRAPVPGGGGAAALTAALAAALCAMAARLTIGKKNFLPYEEDHQRIIAAADALRERFLRLIEEDAAAFEPLSKIYAMDKSLPGYPEKLTEATLNAAEAPFAVLRCCCDLIVLLEELREKCSVLLLSDVGCAAASARSVLECAAMNVFVNTRLLPDSSRARDLAAQTEAMLREFVPRAQAVSDSVTAFLREPK